MRNDGRFEGNDGPVEGEGLGHLGQQHKGESGLLLLPRPRGGWHDDGP